MKFTAALLPVLFASCATAQRFEIRVGNAVDFDSAGNDRPSFRDSQTWQTDCRVSSTFEAEIFAVPDPAHAPKELAWAMNFLDDYWKTDDGGDLPYPGDFDRFMHRDGFRVIRIDYKDLPWPVRKYREQLLEEGKAVERKFIAEYKGVAFFAPGVVTWLAPLFAGKDVVSGQDSCKDELVLIDNFHKRKASSEGVRFASSRINMVQVGEHVVLELKAERQSKVKNAKELFEGEL